MLLIYGILATMFRSYWQPLIVMSVIPFGLIGALAGHMIMGHALTMMSLFGLVALSGVVVTRFPGASRLRQSHQAAGHPH